MQVTGPVGAATTKCDSLSQDMISNSITDAGCWLVHRLTTATVHQLLILELDPHVLSILTP